MTGFIMGTQTVQNRFFLSGIVFAGMLWLGILGFSRSAGAQSVDAGKLQKILTESDSARSMLNYTGIVEIQPGFERLSLWQIRVWARGKDLYFQEPLLPPGMMRPERRGREFPRHRRFGGRMPFGDEHDDFALMPSQEYLDLFLRNYQVQYLPADFIAGRPTNLLDIKPNFLPRFGMRLWLDQKNFLVLKREIIFFTPEDEIVALRFHFKKIQFDVMPPDSILERSRLEMFPERDHPSPPEKMIFPDLQTLKSKIHTRVFVPQFIPPGCELISIRFTKEKHRDVIQLHFTDGLLNFSIFQFNGRPPHALEGMLQQHRMPMNRSLHFQQILAKRMGDTAFLLIGNFPPEQLEQIADSLIEY